MAQQYLPRTVEITVADGQGSGSFDFGGVIIKVAVLPPNGSKSAEYCLEMLDAELFGQVMTDLCTGPTTIPCREQAHGPTTFNLSECSVQGLWKIRVSFDE